MTIDISPIPNFVPSGFKTVNVVLAVENAARAIEFYNRAFNADEVMRLTDPQGFIVHAEIKINDTIIMLTEDISLGGTSATIQLYVGDVEGFVEEAIKAGCELVDPIEVQIYGDRAARVKDPFGHQWIVATHIEDVTARELHRRFNDLY